MLKPIRWNTFLRDFLVIQIGFLLYGLALALLIRAGDFRVPRHALAFGVAAGIGLLVKQTFAFFFVLPALYVVIRVLLTRDRRAILNLALAAVVMIVVASVSTTASAF